MNSAAATAAVKSVGEARPPRFVECSVASESEPELAESSDDEAEPGCARPSRKETVEAVTLVPCERVQQWNAEQIVNLTPRKQADSFDFFGMRAFLHFVCVPLCFVCNLEGRKEGAYHLLKEFWRLTRFNALFSFLARC